MIYFDNAATTFPKPSVVLEQTFDFLRTTCGNPGRSGHALSIETAERVYDCREKLANLLGLSKPENICFTQNATYALNIAIKGILTSKCHVIISDLEHNSVIRPLKKAANKYDCEISIFDSNKSAAAAILPLIKEETKLIITTLCSNVTGKIIDIEGISKICKEKNLKLIVDASQLIGHKTFDMNKYNVDILCAPGHKALFGMQGVGFIAFNNSIDIDTLFEGGSGSNSISDQMPLYLPEKFEAGTLSSPSIISLSLGIDFLKNYGFKNIENRIDRLTRYLNDALDCIKKITLYGCENGICSFNIGTYTSAEIADYLNQNEICVRSGLHCAPLIHQKFKTEERGAVRISLSIFNTEKEIDRFYTVLSKIQK